MHVATLGYVLAQESQFTDRQTGFIILGAICAFLAVYYTLYVRASRLKDTGRRDYGALWVVLFFAVVGAVLFMVGFGVDIGALFKPHR